MTMIGRRGVIAGGTAVAVLGGLSGRAAAQAAQLKFSHQSSVTHPFHIAAVRFSERLAAETGGKLDLKVFPTAQLGSAQQAAEGLLLGNVDITPAGTPLLASFVPELNVVNMPFVFRDAAHFDKTFAADSPVFKTFADLLAAKGFRFLGMFSAGERHFMTKRPVRSMADLKGLKFRSIENPAYIAAFSAFGTNPVAIAYPELYGALQTGVVDGADGANTNYFVEKFYEVAPHWAVVNWLTFSNPLVMSERKFRGLPKDQQDAMLKVGDEVCRFERELWKKSDDEKLPELQAKGVTVAVLDQAPFREASKAVYDRFLKSDRERQLLEAIQKIQ